MHISSRRVSSSNWLERKILLAVLSVVERPRLALVVATLMLLVSGISALVWLNVSSDEDRLFSDKIVAFREYKDFDRKFPENDALYVVIEAKNPAVMPPLLRWTSAADAVARSVKQFAGRYVVSVDARVPLDQLGTQALLFQQSDELRDNFAHAVELAQLARLWGEQIDASSGNLLARGQALLMGRTPSARFLSAVAALPSAQAVSLVQQVSAGWNQALALPQGKIEVGGVVPDLAALAADDPGDLGYYWQPDSTDANMPFHPEKAAHLLLVRIYPRISYSTLSATSEPVAAIRAAIKLAAADFPEFNIGSTGRPALDADEMITTDRDSSVAEIIAAVAVFIGLLVMLRSIWLALAAEIALGFGIAWTFGWATLVIGELNLLSIVFLIALIGIGMDYLVQVLTRYRTEARRHGRPKAIWARVFRHVAAPINTACFGAAGAFLVSIFTRFRGAADLGIIAGGGLLLCLLAGYTVLPALLTLFPPSLAVDFARRPKGTPAAPRGARWLILPAAWVCVIAIFSCWSSRTHFDSNLLDLQAQNLESTQLVRKLETWSSVVLSKDLEMLNRIRSELRPIKVVASTESILIARDNYRWLAAHQNQLPKIDWQPAPPMTPEDVKALAEKAGVLAERLSHLPAADSPPQNKQRSGAIDSLRAFALQAATFPADETARRLSEWQAVFAAELRELLARLSPGPLNLAKLPAEMRSHYASADGTYALYINPNPNLNLWDRRQLAAFVNQVNEAVAKVPGHPGVTGLPVEIYYTTREVRNSFTNATIYALVVILVLVLIDLRNLVHTLLAVSVLGLGLPLLIGLMGLLGQNWNFANFFGLPILIGAGHEYGVFMIHRYRESVRDPRRVWHFWDVADRALLLCAYITSSSFGFFWAISDHRGLKSLGFVMALGTACIYLSTIMVLRPLLLWRLEKKTGV